MKFIRSFYKNWDVLMIQQSQKKVFFMIGRNVNINCMIVCYLNLCKFCTIRICI